MWFNQGGPTNVKTLLSNFFMVQEFTHSDLLNGVYWTLQIEVKFYLVIAIFVYGFGSGRIYWLLGGLLLLNVALLPVMGRGSTLVTYLSAFFPGIAAARASARGWERQGIVELTVVTALVALNLLVGLDQGSGYQASYAVLFSIALAAALLYPVRSGVFAFFGKISYSDYLYHAFVGYAVIAWFAAESQSARIVAFCVAFLASVILAIASFHFVERPCVALGHRLEKHLPAWRIFQRPSAPEAKSSE